MTGNRSGFIEAVYNVQERALREWIKRQSHRLETCPKCSIQNECLIMERTFTAQMELLVLECQSCKHQFKSKYRKEKWD